MKAALLAILTIAALAGCAPAPNPCPPGTTYLRVFQSCAALPGARNVGDESAPPRY
jgi:hypothetical protein